MSNGDKTNELILRGQVGSAEQFGVTHSPELIGRALPNIRTVKDVLALSLDVNPTLARLRELHGNDFIEAYLEMWIKDINEFFNIKRKMSQRQMNSTAVLIVEQFWRLTIADIKVLFTDVKKGLYSDESGNTLYQSIDGVDIMRWFNQYFDERCETAAELSSKEHFKTKKQEDEPITSEVSKKYIQEILDRLKAKTASKAVPVEKGRKKTPPEVMVEIATGIQHKLLTTSEQIVNNYGVSRGLAARCIKYFGGFAGQMGALSDSFNPKKKEYKDIHEDIMDEVNKLNRVERRQ